MHQTTKDLTVLSLDQSWKYTTRNKPAHYIILCMLLWLCRTEHFPGGCALLEIVLVQHFLINDKLSCGQFYAELLPPNYFGLSCDICVSLEVLCVKIKVRDSHTILPPWMGNLAFIILIGRLGLGSRVRSHGEWKSKIHVVDPWMLYIRHICVFIFLTKRQIKRSDGTHIFKTIICHGKSTLY